MDPKCIFTHYKQPQLSKFRCLISTCSLDRTEYLWQQSCDIDQNKIYKACTKYQLKKSSDVVNGNQAFAFATQRILY